MAKFTFLHKSHKRQVIARDPGWTDLVFKANGIARKRFYCDASGTIESQLYLPLSFTGEGLVRVRLVRDRQGKKPMDPTGYDERVLSGDSDGFARVRFFYRGVAEKGRRYYWQAQILGDAKATAVGTHYAEFWRK